MRSLALLLLLLVAPLAHAQQAPAAPQHVALPSGAIPQIPGSAALPGPPASPTLPEAGQAGNASAPAAAHSQPYGHKALGPLEPNDVALFVLSAVALFIASGAGVGGGVLLVPALLLIGRFNAIVAVALSNITILASAVANMVFNIPRRSPVRPGPLIDWDLVLLFGPPTVAGSIAGSYVNMVIPSWVTKVLLFLLLLPMTWRMVAKARLLFQAETAARSAKDEVVFIAPVRGGALDLTREEPAPAAEGRAQASCAQAGCSNGAAGAVREACGSSGGCGAGGGGNGCRGPLARADSGSSSSGGGGSDRVLARISATLAATETPADVFGPEMVHLSTTLTAAHGGGEDDHSSSKLGDSDVEQGGGSTAPASAAAALSAAGRTAGPAAGAATGSGDCWRARASSEAGPAPAGAPSKLPVELCDAVAARMQKEEAAQLPPLQVSLLVLILVSVAATNIPGGFLVECGTWQYWLTVLSPLAVMLLVGAASRRHILWKAGWKRRLGLEGPRDLKWDARTTLVYPCVCVSAGVIAGLLGLGGGLVLAPLMLELGVNPSVSAASTQVTLLISSSTSAIVYAVNDSIPWDYGAALVAIGFLATLLGQWLVSWLVRRLGRSSVLVMILAVMFLVSAACALAVVVTTAVDLARDPSRLAARKGVCPTFH